MNKCKARHTPTFFNEDFICKFNVKAGFKPCQTRYKVFFYNKESAKVSVWSNKEEHEHEEIEYTTDVNFKWTKFQTSIIGSYIGNNKLDTAGHNCNKQLLNLLKEAGALNNETPTVDQVGSKKRSMLKKLAKERSIDGNTLEITDEKIESHSNDIRSLNLHQGQNMSTIGNNKERQIIAIRLKISSP